MPITINDLKYTYGLGTPMQSQALDGVNLTIEDGEFIGIIGHTGSGKSTLVQHFNALLYPTSGTISVDGIEIKKGQKLKEIRQKVGLVFQYPEHQLFEETIWRDIAFGPKNLGLSDEEVTMRVKYAMDMVNLDYNVYKDLSPFDLSGGQMRRVAIAGVLAMKPTVLVLDEPTAGLDPRSRDEILAEIKKMHEMQGITIVLVSHSMEDVAKLASRLIVMAQGQIALQGTPHEVFLHQQELVSLGLGVPLVTTIMHELKKKMPQVNANQITTEEACTEILRVLGRDKPC